MPVLVKAAPRLVGVCPGIGHWATVSGRVVSTDPEADHLDEAGMVAGMVRRRLRTIRYGLHPDGIVY